MKNVHLFLLRIILLITAASVLQISYPQVFTKIKDPSNPVVTDTWSGQYVGASWIDFDNDGLLDLYICGKPLYRNTGDGNFQKVTTALSSEGGVLGNSWADYDNDGDIDCFLVATASNTLSYLFRNNGDKTFTKITSGVISEADSNTGFGCSWADYNNDGYVDLVIASANNFGVVHHPSRFYENNGDGTFSKIDTILFTTHLSSYTIPTWSDYDLDGDIDLFIGSGPANGNLARDYLFDNLLNETGIPYLSRINTGIIGTDQVDGQVWNWIDYDNDGDMDAFLTNYRSATPNNLYRNEGNQFFIKTTAQQVGAIASDIGQGLTNVWGDFDNDGDLDCIVTNDNTTSRYYTNNNDGTFTKITTLAIIGNGPRYGVTVGDYNNDGFLDLYIAGTNTTKGLYRNDSQNGNSWINIKCIGIGDSTGSNFSAIGTKVKAKATINGNPVWQMREISSQNSFNSMNMLNVHFGFGDATIIDSLVIEWTRGIKDVYTNVGANKFYEAVEGQSIIVGVIDKEETSIKSFRLEQNYPNPFNPNTMIGYSIPQESNIILKVYDVLGNEIKTLLNEEKPAGNYQVDFNASNLSSGVYFYQLKVMPNGKQARGFIRTRKMVLIK